MAKFKFAPQAVSDEEWQNTISNGYQELRDAVSYTKGWYDSRKENEDHEKDLEAAENLIMAWGNPELYKTVTGKEMDMEAEEKRCQEAMESDANDYASVLRRCRVREEEAKKEALKEELRKDN